MTRNLGQTKCKRWRPGDPGGPRDNWRITWSDGDTFDYYGDDPEKYARSCKEFDWGLTFSFRRN